MEASAPTPLIHTIQAEEVCEYTFKVELIEKDKVSIVVFNTTTGIKYQTYIEEYSDIWESLKINFQHNFSLFYKMFTKALIEKDPSFTINVLHKIDYVDLQVSYVNDLLGFTIELNVNQYKKDNLQESFNVMEYKQKLLEDENKSLRTEVKNIHQELTELKRIINLLGDGFSYDNRLIKCDSCMRSDQLQVGQDLFVRGTHHVGVTYLDNRGTIGAPSIEVNSFGRDQNGMGLRPFSYPRINYDHIQPAVPFINVEIANKLSIKFFHAIIDKYKLSYDIKHFGYDWNKLENMLKEAGVTQELSHIWQNVFTGRDPSYNANEYQLFTYDFTWKSFKELYDITI
jgi:hypothetical protein